MRTLEIPDAPGYWWQIDKGDSKSNRQGSKQLIEVAIGAGFILVRETHGHLWTVLVHPKFYRWIGPIPEPANIEERTVEAQVLPGAEAVEPSAR